MSDATRSSRDIAASRIHPLKEKKQGDTLYLDIDDRVVWMRRDHPGASITTELLKEESLEYEWFDNAKKEWRVVVTRQAIVHATVSLPSGATSSAIGSETKSDFNDYIEKAGTKAIGRALDNLGYSLKELQWDATPNRQTRVSQPQTSNPGNPGAEATAVNPDGWDGGGMYWRKKIDAALTIKPAEAALAELAVIESAMASRKDVPDIAKRYQVEAVGRVKSAPAAK